MFRGSIGIKADGIDDLGNSLAKLNVLAHLLRKKAKKEAVTLSEMVTISSLQREQAVKIINELIQWGVIEAQSVHPTMNPIYELVEENWFNFSVGKM